MQCLGVKRFGDILRFGQVLDMNECVIEHLETDACLGQLPGEPIVSIEMDLKTKWRPGGNTRVAQTELFINKVKVIVYTLA